MNIQEQPKQFAFAFDFPENFPFTTFAVNVFAHSKKEALLKLRGQLAKMITEINEELEYEGDTKHEGVGNSNPTQGS